MGVRLPKEYQEVEYIEGARGAQYINTGISGNDDNLVIEAKVKPGAYSQYCSLWGNYVAETYNVTRLIAGAYSYNVLSALNQRAGSGVNAITFTLFGTGKIFTIVQSKTNIEINGTSYAVTNRSTGTANNTPIAINAAKVGNPASETTTQRFYYFRMSSSEVVLIDLVPCYRKSDRKPGMFDLVSKTFFTNAGTGEFLVGDDIVYHKAGNLYQLMPLLMAQPHRESIAGINGIATFDDDFKGLMKLSVPFSPVQEGSGDPSPDNVRPISGFDEANIFHTPKNILPKTLPSTAIAGTFGTGSTSISSASNARVFSLYVGKNRKLYYSRSSGVGIAFAFTDAPVVTRTGVVLYGAVNCANRASESFDSGNHPYLVVNISSAGAYNVTIDTTKTQLIDRFSGQNYSYTKRENWEPIPVAFINPSTGTLITLYGGTFALYENGDVDLIQTWSIVDLGTLTWSWNSSLQCFESGYIYNSPANYEDVVTIICDCYTAMPNGQSPPYDKTIIFNKSSGATRSYFRIKDADYGGDATAFKAAMSGHWAAYRLRPEGYTTYRFSSDVQLKSLLDRNLVWTDLNGDPTVGYWKHG